MAENISVLPGCQIADGTGPNVSQEMLSQVGDKLHGQLDKLFDVDALLCCAEETLVEKDDYAESARRTIHIARRLLSDIRNRIDEATLELH